VIGTENTIHPFPASGFDQIGPYRNGGGKKAARIWKKQPLNIPNIELSHTPRITEIYIE
jgi:hypothetical protein